MTTIDSGTASRAAAPRHRTLNVVRLQFVNAGWCRKTVNQQAERIRRIFKWAASEELVSAAVYHALANVTGLQRGRTPAREPEPVGPVDDAVVDATLPHLNRHVRGSVEFQRLTGCRPGEACKLRRCDRRRVAVAPAPPQVEAQRQDADGEYRGESPSRAR